MGGMGGDHVHDENCNHDHGDQAPVEEIVDDVE